MGNLEFVRKVYSDNEGAGDLPERVKLVITPERAQQIRTLSAIVKANRGLDVFEIVATDWSPEYYRVDWEQVESNDEGPPITGGPYDRLSSSVICVDDIDFWFKATINDDIHLNSEYISLTELDGEQDEVVDATK